MNKSEELVNAITSYDRSSEEKGLTLVFSQLKFDFNFLLTLT